MANLTPAGLTAQENKKLEQMLTDPTQRRALFNFIEEKLLHTKIETKDKRDIKKIKDSLKSL